MAEEPIKLFATRAERYPQLDDTDKARSAIEKITDQVPILGPATVHIVSQFLVPAYHRRQEEWFKELANALEAAEKKIEGFSVENLVQDEVFVSAVIQASRIAVTTHQQTKREALRNAALNAALMTSPDDDEVTMFLGFIETFSSAHLVLLKFFSNRGGHSHDHAMALINRRTLTDPMILELNSRGLLKDPRPYVSRNRDIEDSLVKQDWTLTTLGAQFMAFISTPELLK